MKASLLLVALCLLAVIVCGNVSVDVNVAVNGHHPHHAHPHPHHLMPHHEGAAGLDMAQDRESNVEAMPDVPASSDLPVVQSGDSAVEGKPTIDHGTGSGMHFGIDVSHYDTIHDYGKVVAALKDMGKGATPFCFVKISEGNANLDKTAPKHIANFMKEGCITGVYHFFHTSAGVNAQVNRIMQNLHGARYVMLDAELDEGRTAGPNALAIIKALQAKEVKVILYTNTPLAKKWNIKNWPVPTWIARYASAQPVVHTDIWQYTESGRIAGTSGKVDLNKSLCTKEKFEEIFS